MDAKSIQPKNTKPKLHPRNKHKHRYNFKKLIEQTPELGNYVAENKYGIETINFFDPNAVKLLNASLLKFDYGIEHWDIPIGYLCPPIPGRADYVHHVADLLGSDDNKRIPKGKKVTCLDVGTGANCIYPIIGVCEYGWNFIASDTNPISVKTAKAIVNANAPLKGNIEVVHQKNKQAFFTVLDPDDFVHTTICNPPFHASKKEAMAANLRKLKNLKGKHEKVAKSSFGGQHDELWVEGGELKFIKDMVKESVQFKEQVLWFTSLVSKNGNLKEIYAQLRKVRAVEVNTINMGQGNKSSRIVAWSFHSKNSRKFLLSERGH